jgi:hypothetical protein
MPPHPGAAPDRRGRAVRRLNQGSTVMARQTGGTAPKPMALLAFSGASAPAAHQGIDSNPDWFARSRRVVGSRFSTG